MPCFAQLTGIVVTQLVWGEVMMGTYAENVCGIHVVLSDGESAYTYEIFKGEATFIGEGDLHLERFDRYAVESVMTPMNLFTNASSSYTLTLYPTEDLYNVYSTRNPAMASIVVVVVMCFTSCLFLIYDLFVRREFNAKKELLSAKRKFVRFVSHEVRTPLNSVCMGLTLLKDEMAAATSATSKERALLQWMTLTDDVLAGARSAVDVLNDFLNYDKIESGKLTLELSVVRIFELIETTVDEFKLPAERKKLKFVVKTPTSKNAASPDDAERFSVGDAMRLTQVFRNLLSNAVKFTPKGGSIEASAYWIPPEANEEGPNSPKRDFKLNNDQKIIVTQAGSIVFSVTDSGTGMTEAQLQDVFGQGTQFNANSLQGGNGSGLGTWIAKGIVRQHAGTLKATSKGIGKGSSFSAIIPVYDIPQDCKPSAAKTLSLRNKNSEEPESLLNILVVDDARMNLKLLMRLLTKSGHTCEGADDGLVAVQKVKTSMKHGKPYDCILMDFQMPNMDGPTAASKIRELGSDAFIVGITGNLMAEDIRHFKEHGANHVLPKPIKLPDLEALFVEYDVRDQTFNGELSTPMLSFLDLSRHEDEDDDISVASKTSGDGSMVGYLEDIV
jgi:signal transduction histidine kinase/DNA-binding NarL/FixJ family response regulator